MTNLQIVITIVIALVIIKLLWVKYYSHHITCLLESLIIKVVGHGLIVAPTLYFIYKVSI